MNTSGVGLGLVISRQITRQFEGDITFESQQGKGSEFTFSFKLESQKDIKLRKKSAEICKQEMKNFQSNIHELVFNWRAKDQIVQVEYVDMKREDECI